MKDYYKILGIEENASQDDIKKSYKKLALKYHPDRHANDTEEQKKEAEEKFKEISEAYEHLGDQNKRAEYDNMKKFGSGGFGGGFGHPFWNMRNRPQKRYYPVGQSLNIKVDLTIEDLFNYDQPKIVNFYKSVRCPECGGKGGMNVETCPHCNGTGTVRQVSQRGNMQMISEYPCNYCQGTGEINKEDCPKCGGQGLKTTVEEIDINKEIPREYLLQNGNAINVSGQGSESRSPEVPNGDLHLLINHIFDTNIYKIDNSGNIIQVIQVPYYDCILGNKSFSFLACDRGYHSIEIPKHTKGGTKLQVSDLHGCTANSKYYVWVKVGIPDKISNEVKAKLKEIKELSDKK